MNPHLLRLVVTLRLLTAVVAVGLLAAGCGSTQPSTTSTTSTATTPSLRYAAPGPHAAAYKARCAALAADDPLTFFCAPAANESDMAERAGLDEVPTGLWPSLGDPRVDAVISLAGDAYLFDQRGLSELKAPVMVMGGTVDDGTPYTWGAKLTYDDAASEDKTLITFPGAGHSLFVDACDDLPWTATFAYRDALCTDAVWGTHRPLDVVAHYTTAFLRDTLDDDAEARASLTGPQPRLDNVEYTTERQP